MKFLVAVVIVILSMALKDVLNTAMIVYESRGNGHRAGLMDSLSDVVTVIYTIVNIDTLNKAGFSLEGAIMLFAICATSYTTTKFTVDKMKNKNI